MGAGRSGAGIGISIKRSPLIARCVWVALAAGLVAGAVSAAAQIMVLTPLILDAEVYEHIAATDAVPNAAADHAHGPGDAKAQRSVDWSRGVYTAAADGLVGIGFGLLLVTALVVRGRPVGWRCGLLWGGGGFAVFALAPALGLPPELPGMPTADLGARQAWWLATGAATAAGLAALAFARRRGVKALGVAILIGPHLVGAPHPPDPAGPVPAVLAAHFAVWSLAVSLAFWAVLGAVAGALFDRWVIAAGASSPASPIAGG